jgi:hypothetical protein
MISKLDARKIIILLQQTYWIIIYDFESQLIHGTDWAFWHERDMVEI